MFDDEVQGTPAAIRGRVTLTPGRYVGDIVAFYFDLTSLFLPLPAPIRTIADSISGADITCRDTNTSNVQAGNIGSVFSIGLAIGGTGIGKNKGDIRTTEFLINTPGLELQHLAAVAVRVQSVGCEYGSREGSRKMSDAAGDWPADFLEAPEPETWSLILLGTGVLAILQKRLPRSL